MKIKKSVLIDFLTKVSMNGTVKVNNFMMEFKPEGMFVLATSGGGVTAVEATLKKDKFEDYEELEQIGVGDIDAFMKAINLNKGEFVEVSIKDMLIAFVSTNGKKSRTIKVESKDSQYIEKDFEFACLDDIGIDWKTKNTFTLDIQDLVDDTIKCMDFVQSDEVTIEIKNKKLILTVTSKAGRQSVQTTQDIDVDINEKCVFGKELFEALSTLKGNVTLSFQTRLPIKVASDSDDNKIAIVIGPREED